MFSSVAQSCQTLCNPMDCSTPGFTVLHQLLELEQLMSIELVIPSNHLILCHPLLLLPSIFPSNRVFSNESVLHISWPKYWSFSFSISPSNGYSGLISRYLVPSEHDSVSLSVSVSQEEASISLLSFSIRGQTEGKPRPQKTNQMDPMDHSLV